jgi:hypothetical protein
LTPLDVYAQAPEATVRPLLSPDDIRWR